jgi:hypothetical protein
MEHYHVSLTLPAPAAPLDEAHPTYCGALAAAVRLVREAKPVGGSVEHWRATPVGRFRGPRREWYLVWDAADGFVLGVVVTGPCAGTHGAERGSVAPAAEFALEEVPTLAAA